MLLEDHCPHHLCLHPSLLHRRCPAPWPQGHPRVEVCHPAPSPQGTQVGPHGQQDLALCAGRGGLLIAYVPTGCSSRGCCILRHYCINIYIYLLYIYCPGSMHGQAEGSAVLLEVQPQLQRCSPASRETTQAEESEGGDRPPLSGLGRGGGGSAAALTRSDAGKATLGRAPTPLLGTGSRREMKPCIAGGGPRSALGDQAGPHWGAGHVLRAGGYDPNPRGWSQSGASPAWLGSA